MPIDEAEHRALEAVAWLTLGSGALQAVVPRLTLDRLSPHPDSLGTHMFATVGMFMTVSGGVLAATLRLPAAYRKAPLAWCAAQKIGAAVAVGIGVRRKILSPMALAVASFDLASGLIAIDYRRRSAG
jgi:hypothetical protein